MTISLASTWQPRGEFDRFRRLYEQLQTAYNGMAIALPPDTPADLQQSLASVGDQVVVTVTKEWPVGRYQALQSAYGFSSGHIHYVDFDRLLRWVETRPQEWHQAITRVQQCDCLIIGRTAAAYCTHPQALVQTERISNLVTSYFIGMPVDVSAGSKGFSRQAVDCILRHTRPGRALGTDAEWLIVLQRVGFRLEYLEVDGLDWEIADQYQSSAANAERQSLVAQAYDADPRNWARRVEVALEIVEVGLETIQRYDGSSGDKGNDR